MTDDLEHLRENYRRMDTEEIGERIRNGTLTEQAHAVALQELAGRGALVDSLPEQPLKVAECEESKPHFLARAWSGKEQLWIVFWVLGFLLNVPLGLASAIRHPLLSGALYVVGVACRFFWLGCVWRSAFRSSHWGWAVLARGYVVVDLSVSVLIFARVFA